jgi:DNA replication and repair protein RecF
MRVKSLTATNFRNFTSAELSPGPGVNVLYGDNGSGKTNFLEAIFTLCLGRSQRGAADSVLLKSGADYYRIQGSVERGNETIELAVAYQPRGRKKITADSVVIKTSELYEHMSLVAAGPEDSEILSGPPSARRLFLDIYLSQLSQTYLADLSDYQKALAQKSAALRREMDPSPFDPLLVEYGVRVIADRMKFLADISVRAGRLYSDIADGEQLSVSYQPKVAVDAEAENENIAAAFEEALDRNAERERVTQSCLVGPHRDEIGFSIGGLPARSHGSQGQWRSAAISLKLAVYEILKEKHNASPILLLDEIFAELDSRRTDSLAAKFTETGQLFLTTAVQPPEALLGDTHRFKIAAGEVVEVN